MSNEGRRYHKSELRLFVSAYLELHPCVDRSQENINYLTFDHIEKRNGRGRPISDLVSKGVKWLVLLKAISRCEIRCFHCHRERHRQEQLMEAER